MKTVAFVVSVFVLLFGVVVAARIAVFYFADPPTLEVTRLSLIETGKRSWRTRTATGMRAQGSQPS